MDGRPEKKGGYKNKRKKFKKFCEGGRNMKKIALAAAITALCIAPLFAKPVDRILVKVNNEVILDSEVNEAVDLLFTQAKMSGKIMDKEALKKDVIKSMIEQKLIITMAKDESVTISEEAVADKTTEFIDSLRKRFSTEAEFEDTLAKEGLSYTDFRMKIDAQVRDNLAFTKVKQKKQQEFITKAGISDDELKNFFEKNRDEFKVNDEMNLSQILIDRARIEAKDARKFAADVSARIAAEGFEKVAADLSGKPGIKALALDWVDTDVFSKEIKSALSGLKKGAVTKPVETEDGFQILKVVDVKKGRVEKFDDIREKVRVKLIEEKVDTMWNDWISKVKKDAYIKYM
jgi:parvulin-like peptidyl-prolyl isomerase